MSVIGLDIGGANLKAAHSVGPCRSAPFPLWRTPHGLADAIAALVKPLPNSDVFAVTMTGELADCFETKAEGVGHILDSVAAVADGHRIAVWQTGAEFVSPEVANEIPLLVAAANWHALATWVGRLIPTGKGLLLDMGSTTTDIIPFHDGFPLPSGLTDRERLESAELIYSGAARTPLCAIAQSVMIRRRSLPLAAEVFATTLDVGIVLGDIPEDANNSETANGKPATRSHCAKRIARQFCCDLTEFSESEVVTAARQIRDQQLQAIQQAINLRSDATNTVVSGSGSSLAESLRLPGLIVHLSQMFDHATAECACAMAAAKLAIERLR